LGGATLFARVSSSPFPLFAVILLICALVGLIIAAGLALAMNVPSNQASYDLAEVRTLACDTDLSQVGVDDVQDAIRTAQFEILQALRRSNDLRGRRLTLAFAIELAALVLVGIAAVPVILAS
jgi:hypothetical protein